MLNTCTIITQGVVLENMLKIIVCQLLFIFNNCFNEMLAEHENLITIITYLHVCLTLVQLLHNCMCAANLVPSLHNCMCANTCILPSD